MADRLGKIRLGLVGIGKIARDQHLPAIAADDRFDLVASASRNASVADIPSYLDLQSMIQSENLDCVSLCTPPDGRHVMACIAIDAGLHVMLEKPPAATLSEIEDLRDRAASAGVALFATWHSRYSGAVEPAKKWLSDKRIDSVKIIWREDIRRWHPGQEWILGPGGFGVFDPGINAFSILTRILPKRLLVEEAQIAIPHGRDAPIAAEILMRSGAASVSAQFDFLQTGRQSWDIIVATDAGEMRIELGGSVLSLPDSTPQQFADLEYARLYERFARCVKGSLIDVDVTPLQLVADALLCASQRPTMAFEF